MKKAACVLMCVVLSGGCASSKSVNDSRSENGARYDVEYRGEKLSAAQIKSFKKQAEAGNGEAAFALFWHYSLGERNSTLKEKYRRRALELECPAALYLEAFTVWSREASPDLAYVERLAARAVELGYRDDKGLLAEIVEARKTGIIPNKTKIRFFP